ncbi:hypothetical protein [Streptomyces sp. NPDC001435]|uniref:hypothetical protein n=1 Tax=unclassified Streptomyces TaxID=2593676 RepID=UPI0036803C83
MITADNLLAGLDEVDWANLDHAYGTADDVPGQLRALCGDPLSGISARGAVPCPDRSRRPEAGA